MPAQEVRRRTPKTVATAVPTKALDLERPESVLSTHSAPEVLLQPPRDLLRAPPFRRTVEPLWQAVYGSCTGRMSRTPVAPVVETPSAASRCSPDASSGSRPCSDPRRCHAGLCRLARLLSQRISPADPHHPRRQRISRWRGLLRAANPAIYDARPVGRGNPPHRSRRGGANYRRDGDG